MKIAIFTDTFYPEVNGVARTLKRFTDYLSEKDISFKIFAPQTTGSEYISDHIYRFKSLSFFLYPECRLAFPNMLHIKSELKNFSPDLIHVATPFSLGMCGVHYAKKLNIPLVGSYHTDFDHYLKYYDLQIFSKMLQGYMMWFHKPLRKIFVPSYETMNQLQKQGFSNLELWPRGVNCNLFHPQYDKFAFRQKYGIRKKYIISYAGRLAPEKDVQTLLSAAKLLPPYLQEQVQWGISGDGPLREKLQSEAPDHFLFTGFLNEAQLAEVYSASDLFVFPSPTETFGNVVLEALASGTPVIGANSGGVKNIIQPSVSGQLCEPGNALQFSESIVFLLMNHEVRMKMAGEGRRYAETQRWEAIFNNLIVNYKDVIQEPSLQKHA